MTFTESNTVEQMILDAASGLAGALRHTAQQNLPLYRKDSGAGSASPARWTYLPFDQVPRQPNEVMVEAWLREALIGLNPEIAAQPDRADEVIYNLRAILLSVQADGLVRANENFMAWLRGEKTMPFGCNGEHVPVRLVDTGEPGNNRLTVTNQWTFQAGAVEKRFDVVFVVNGLPLVIAEAKTPTRRAVTWFDGAFQINQIYEREVPAMFVPNVFSFATEGRCFRYGSIRMPIDMWGPWRDDDNQDEGQLQHVRATVASMLRPEVALDILQHFTLFATDKKHRRIKVICRYQQYETTNKIVARVVAGYPKKGLIWHFQGSGKSLLMVFAAQKLRLHPRLGNPTVMIVVGLFAAVCLLPPTVLMGATLPAISRWIEITPRGISWLGFFYGGNLAGAVFGCLLAGFYLLRVHDSAVATGVAAAINGAVALAAFALAAFVRHEKQEAADEGAFGVKNI